MLGTLISVAAIVAGGIAGVLLGDRLPQRVRETVVHGLGLVVVVVGLQMALSTRNLVIVLVSILIGALLGEWWGIERVLEGIGHRLEARFQSSATTSTDDAGEQRQRSLSRAFVTSSLVFCVGPISILGPVQDGLAGDHRLLLIKSVLDGVGALAFGAVMGPGVLLSAVSVLVYQGSIGLAAMGFASALGNITRDNPAIVEMTATGGVLIVGIGLAILEIRRMRVGNMLPAVAVAPLLVTVLRALGIHV